MNQEKLDSQPIPEGFSREDLRRDTLIGRTALVNTEKPFTQEELRRDTYVGDGFDRPLVPLDRITSSR